MESSMLRIEGFTGEDAVIKAKFPVDDVYDEFRKKMEEYWSEAADKLQLSDTVVVQGEFGHIDEGKRWLRFVFGFTGWALIEVKGCATMADRTLSDFHFCEVACVGKWGGEGKQMLIKCAQIAARKIVKIVSKELGKKSE